MRPVNVTPEDKALEALVAASLRCPDKLPEISQNAIRRFVEQHVTLNEEDEAALARTKPLLFEGIDNILAQRKPDHSISNSRATRNAEHPIPAALAGFASRQKLSILQTRQLLGMRLEILGHRSTPGSDDLETFDWERFYKKVKEFLK